MASFDIRLVGTITAVQPISIIAPAAEGAPRGIKNYARRQVVQPNGEVAETLVIPATTIRGRLRRLAFAPVAEALKGLGKPPSLDAYYFSVIGQTRSSEDEKEYVDLEAIATQRKENPVASLFGSGIGLASRLRVRDAVPTAPVTGEVVRFTRKDIDADEGLGDLLDKDSVKDWVRRANANSQRAKLDGRIDTLQRRLRQKGSEEAETIRAEIAELEKQTKAYAIEAGSAVSIKQLLDYTAIPENTVMEHSILALRIDETEAGILLDALDGFSSACELGGQVARGCGEIAASYALKVRSTGARDWQDIASLSLGNFEPMTIRTVSDEAAELLQSWRDAHRVLISQVQGRRWTALADA
jgi:CRISPR type IV-associated protein Csf2